MNLSFHQFIQQIFLQGLSCYAPLNWQWLPCFTQQPSSPQRQSIQRLWKTKSNSITPSRCHIHGAEAANPLLLPRLCQFVFHLHCLFQAWCLFSHLWRREGGERKLFMNVVLYLLSFLCLCSLFLQSAQFLYSAAACRTREEPGPTAVAHLPWGSWGGGRTDFC